MLFSSEIFLFLFLPVTLGIYYIVRNKSIRTRNTVLLLASVLFYSWGEAKFIYIMLISIVFNYIFGLNISCENERKRRFLLILSVAFNLGILFTYKYLDFSIETVNSLFCLSIPKTEIRLPLGISFFTFQAMSYVIDVYRKNASVQKNIFELALYIFFFPQLIAGPIVI